MPHWRRWSSFKNNQRTTVTDGCRQWRVNYTYVLMCTSEPYKLQPWYSRKVINIKSMLLTGGQSRSKKSHKDSFGEMRPSKPSCTGTFNTCGWWYEQYLLPNTHRSYHNSSRQLRKWVQWYVCPRIILSLPYNIVSFMLVTSITSSGANTERKRMKQNRCAPYGPRQSWIEPTHNTADSVRLDKGWLR